MALVDLFLDSRPRIANVTIDGASAVEHGRTAELSTYPTEDGVDRSDHRKKNQATLTLSGLVSNVVWNPNYRISDFIAESNTLDFSRHKTAWNALQDAFESDEVMSVSVDLQAYDSMSLISLTATEQPGEKEVLRFSAGFRKVATAYTSFVAAAAAEVADIAATAAEAGGKQTQSTSAAELASAEAIADALGLIV